MEAISPSNEAHLALCRARQSSAAFIKLHTLKIYVRKGKTKKQTF